MKIKYPFTKGGIGWFEEDTMNDIMNNLEHDDPQERNESENDFNILITIGNREIKVPMIPESFESITDFLKTTLEEMEQC